MDTYSSTILTALVAAALLLGSAPLDARAAGARAFDQDAADEQELRRSDVPDATPRQFYDSAIREAGGAYKMAIADCLAGPAPERAACRQEASALYRHDMADARAQLQEHRP